MKTTEVFKRNLLAFTAGKRVIANKGSTRSSKTWSIMQLLYIIAELSEEPIVISITSESFPHLKKGCIRDFETMLRNDGKWDARCWNATDKIYRTRNGIIEFFSVDQPAKVHGPARDILFINECINIEYETYRQLAIRTRGTIFLDYNPGFEFWVDEKVLPRPEAELIHSTYLNNDFLTLAQIQEIESNKHDKQWWDVYGLGITGSRDGLIMNKWDVVRIMPETYKHRWIGLDFGFTNDPTAIIDVRLSNGDLYIRELLFAKSYDNNMIAKHLLGLNIKDTLVIADSSEPKSISEIAAFGINIEPASKPKGSINVGLDILNRYNKHITSDSLNVISEFRNYRWKKNKIGDNSNDPIELHNHSIDAIRYVAFSNLANQVVVFNAQKEDW